MSKTANFYLRYVTSLDDPEENPTQYDRNSLKSDPGTAFTDIDIQVIYKEVNFSQEPILIAKGIQNSPEVKYLVKYDAASETVYVDERAPVGYKKLAALHEIICCGHHFEDWAGVEGDDSSQRCRRVEKAIFEKGHFLFDRLHEYFFGRLDMFRFLLENNISRDNKASFKESLIYVDDVVRHFGGSD